MTYLTEKEQLEIFSRWWKENGTAVVITVTLSLAGYFGWTTWQKQQAEKAEKASAIYQELLDARQKNGNLADLADKTAQLKNEYGNTFYGEAVHLWLAEEAVKAGNLETARQELEALVAKKPEERLLLTARLRLARVLYAQGKFDEALAGIQATVPDAYLALYAELRGDILAAQKKGADARKAYEEALASINKAGESRGQGMDAQIIEMKLNNLAAP